MPTLEVGRLPARPNPDGGLTLLPVAVSLAAEIAASSRELRQQGDARVWSARFAQLPQDSIVLGGRVDDEFAVFMVLRIVNDETTLQQMLRPAIDLGEGLGRLAMPLSFPVGVTLWMEVSERFRLHWGLAFRQVMTQHALVVMQAHGCTAHAMRIEDQGHPEELASAVNYHLFPAEPASSPEQVAWLHNGRGDEFHRRALLLAMRAERGELPRSQWRGDPRYRMDDGTPRE